MTLRYLAASLMVGFFALGVRPAAAQLTLEHRYPGQSLRIGKLSSGDWKYYGINEATNQLRFYDLNHTLTSQITLPIVAGYGRPEVYIVSDALFDTNPATLEAYVCLFSTTGNLPSKAFILRDNGLTVSQLDTTGFAYAVETSAGAKLITGNGYYNGTTYMYGSRVYALPGHVALRRPDDGPEPAADRAAPYPNPTADQLHLPYAVPAGYTATLTVRDGAGREVRRFTVDDTFSELLLDGRTLAPGTYSYSVEVPGRAPVAGRPFVVAR